MIRFVTQGGIATDEAIDRRREVCRGCEFFDPEWSQCEKCGCFTPLKTQLTTERCPVGKWKEQLTARNFPTLLVSHALRYCSRVFHRR